MDLLSKQSLEVTTLALNGLAQRHKAIIANVANADTPGYQRTDVKFEDQLAQIVDKENKKQELKESYSAGLKYSPDLAPESPFNNLNKMIGMSLGAYNKLNAGNESYSTFKPEVMNTDDPPVKLDGNNVNIEHEMVELSKTATRYTAITMLQAKMFKGMNRVIKGNGA